MDDLIIRRATEADIPALERLLYQVHQVHSDVRPDLFRPGCKKYTVEALHDILNDSQRPVFAAQRNNNVVGYAFCIHQQHGPDSNLTDVKTLYIDDLCVDRDARGDHIGTRLYEHVISYAKAQGYYNVTLNVWADNTDAVKFYQSLGLHVQKIGMEQILDD